MDVNKTNMDVTRNKISTFMSVYGRWIAGILLILILSWADERYVSHDELNTFSKEKKVDEIIPLIGLEGDLRQRQDKKIIMLDAINHNVIELDKKKSIFEAVSQTEDRHLEKDIEEIKRYFSKEIDRLEKIINDRYE